MTRSNVDVVRENTFRLNAFLVAFATSVAYLVGTLVTKDILASIAFAGSLVLFGGVCASVICRDFLPMACIAIASVDALLFLHDQSVFGWTSAVNILSFFILVYAAYRTAHRIYPTLRVATVKRNLRLVFFVTFLPMALVQFVHAIAQRT